MTEAAQAAETETETRVAAVELALAEQTEACKALRRRGAALNRRLREHSTLMDPDSLGKQFHAVVEAAMHGDSEVGGDVVFGMVQPGPLCTQPIPPVVLMTLKKTLLMHFTLDCPLTSHPPESSAKLHSRSCVGLRSTT